MRLVLDLRHVNEYLDFPKLKYGDLRTAWQYFEKDAYFIAFDLKSVFTKLMRTLVKKKMAQSRNKICNVFRRSNSNG